MAGAALGRCPFCRAGAAPIEAISHARPAAANEKRRRASGADGAFERPARAAPLRLAGQPARLALARGVCAGGARGRQGHHPCRAHRLQGGGGPPHRGGERRRDRGPFGTRTCRRSGHDHRRLWRRPRADGAVRAIPRRVVHRGRPACRARACQPHLPASPCTVLALPPGAPHRRLEPRHRARRLWRRHHRAHGGVELDPDRGRASHDLRPHRLLFRLYLRRGRAAHRRALCVVYLLGERTAHRHPPRHERVRYRGAFQGGRQPAQLRDGQIFRQRGARGAALRFLHGALREGGDPHLYLARCAQHRAGGDLHHRHGRLHAAGGARRDARRAHRGRLRDDQRYPHAALPAAQLHGHGLSRDQAGPDRYRDHVRAAARAGGDRRPERRQAAPRDQGRDQVRERLLRLRS